jgi:heme exporter protein A
MKMKNKKTTTIMVTHDFHQAIEVCDRVIIIKNGLIADDFYIKEHSLQLLTEKYVQQVESAS